MYEVRRTMYDLNCSAPEAREFCEACAEKCPGAAIGGSYKAAGRRGRLTPPMYDVRCTVHEFARVARGRLTALGGTVYDCEVPAAPLRIIPNRTS